jgi:outer membrane protein, multidrug efflux system
LPDMFNKISKTAVAAAVVLSFTACVGPALVGKETDKSTPQDYTSHVQDTVNSAQVGWKTFFTDPNLVALIDTALRNNQEFNISLQEIAISRNEIRVRKGDYIPFLDVRGGAGVEKVGRYTSKGSSEATTEIRPGQETPEPLPDFTIGAYASWEIDIWHKLRNAKEAAVDRYLASVEGRKFLQTSLVSEIAINYYELLALDNQLSIAEQNIGIQSNALEVVKAQKEGMRVTELAVKRFEAQVLNTKSLIYDVRQKIVETENRINFLLGRYPQPVQRDATNFPTMVPDTVYSGVPTQLLENRPDIHQAELNLAAAKLDVKAAKANFYPSLRITGGVGLQSFNPKYLASPESVLYSLAGDLVAPVINRNAIKATYYNANAKQLQAVYEYDQTLLNAYIEVSNQLSRINNLRGSYDMKAQEVDALTQSVEISGNLFASARADYMEVLITQRDVLESRFELIEIKMQQMHAVVDIYRALGGGWR